MKIPDIKIQSKMGLELTLFHMIANFKMIGLINIVLVCECMSVGGLVCVRMALCVCVCVYEYPCIFCTHVYI